MLAPTRIAAAVLIALALAPIPAWALGDTNVTATNSVAAGGSITSSTINIGMPPEQVQFLVTTFTQQLGAAGEARAKAETQAAQFAAQLGVTRDAVVSFFRILGEKEVPAEQMPVRLGEVAARFHDLSSRLATLEPEDPTAKGLVDQAQQAVEGGKYDEADGLLARAEEIEQGAAGQA